MYKRLGLILICLSCLWVFTIPSLWLLNDWFHFNELAFVLEKRKNDLVNAEKELRRVESQLLMGTNDLVIEKLLRQEESDLRARRILLQNEINITEEKLQRIEKILQTFDVNPKRDGLLKVGLEMLSIAANIFGTIFPIVVIMRWIVNKWNHRRQKPEEQIGVAI